VVADGHAVNAGHNSCFNHRWHGFHGWTRIETTDPSAPFQRWVANSNLLPSWRDSFRFRMAAQRQITWSIFARLWDLFVLIRCNSFSAWKNLRVEAHRVLATLNPQLSTINRSTAATALDKSNWRGGAISGRFRARD